MDSHNCFAPAVESCAFCADCSSHAAAGIFFGTAMSKRFVDTELFRKAWYRRLPCRQKALWEHLRLACDASGVLDADWDSISFHIGEQMAESDLELLKEQVEILPSGKLFLKDFIGFQYGILSTDCRPHQKIFELIRKNGIERVLDTLSDRVLDRDKEEEEDKDKKGSVRGKFVAMNPPTVEQCIEFGNTIGLPDEDCRHFHDHHTAGGWKIGTKPMKDWQAAMRNWKRNWKIGRFNTGSKPVSKPAGNNVPLA